MSNFKPAQYSVFKGKSAFRLSLARPKEDFGLGFLFIEFANAQGKNDSGNRIYDWNSKIGVKLSMVDISKLSYALEFGESVELFHKYGDSSKVVSLNRADSGQSPYFLSVSIGESKISVPIASEEAYALLTLLKYAIPKILNW